MEAGWKESLWQQFGASLDMLENAINACPDKVWGDHADWHEFWYITYHTLFFLDYYLEGKEEGFKPLKPYTLSELDPKGLFPDKVYSKEEMLSYLAFGRDKSKKAIFALSDDSVHRQCDYNRPGITVFGLLLYTMRHVQHHAAQLNLLLRQSVDSAPRWVSKTDK